MLIAPWLTFVILYFSLLLQTLYSWDTMQKCQALQAQPCPGRMRGGWLGSLASSPCNGSHGGNALRGISAGQRSIQPDQELAIQLLLRITLVFPSCSLLPSPRLCDTPLVSRGGYLLRQSLCLPRPGHTAAAAGIRVRSHLPYWLPVPRTSGFCS